ncbi:LuxR C-terminal-related transcriptional regulator [Brevibacillus sp. SYSU BS000544]|uniref:LuxR C-terminal-related transcriptional regulator n=1 Tax=Brevibacillus sp. SYSU BS000544 TaxID=3416443 RepID=UPI003CE491E8
MHSERVENDIDDIEKQFLVGRKQEIETFMQFLTGKRQEKIINIFGMGGVGKSFLLDEFRRIAIGHDVNYVEIDARDFIHTPEGLCGHILSCFNQTLSGSSTSINDCINLLHQEVPRKKVILVFDTYEELGELEHWFKEHFFPKLPPGILGIISGRYPLQNSWLLSPAWRKLIYRMPLGELNFSEVKEYLQKYEIDDSLTYDIWKKTKGHPLTLSLAAYNASEVSGMGTDEDIFSVVVQLWLKEVPNEQMRQLVEAAAVLRQFNQDILSFVVDSSVQSTEFSDVINLSFVRKVKRGWIFHDLVRAAIGQELRKRTPERFNELWKRSALYHYNKIMKQANQGDVEWESSEWFYYLGTNIIHAFFYQATSPYYFEPLDQSNFAEAQAYINWRKQSAKDDNVVFSTPDTTEKFEFFMTEQENLMPLRHVNLQELYEIDPGIVKLFRNAEGQVAGLSVAIPINEKTVDYLSNNPLSSAYFKSLGAKQVKELKVPENTKAGWFVKSIDIPSFEDETSRAAAGLHFISLFLSGGFIVASPPPLPMFRDIHLSLGCSVAEGVYHTDYDGKTPTPTYVLDTRGNRLKEYLTKMLHQLGIQPEEEEKEEQEVVEESGSNTRSILTPREQEITSLLLEGLTNKEIADRLYISEITVKKALSLIFQKTNSKNRSQLVKNLMK